MKIRTIGVALVALLLGTLFAPFGGGVADASHGQQVAWFQGYPLHLNCGPGESPMLFFSLRISGDNMLAMPEGADPGDFYSDVNAGAQGGLDDVLDQNPDIDFRLHTFWRDRTNVPIEGFNTHLNVPEPYDVKLHQAKNGELFQTVAWRFIVGTEDARLFTTWAAWAVPDGQNPAFDTVGVQPFDSMRLTQVRCPTRYEGNPNQDRFIPTSATRSILTDASHRDSHHRWAADSACLGVLRRKGPTCSRSFCSTPTATS